MMKRSTLEKLRANPHYKPTPDVKRAIDSLPTDDHEEPVQTFGKLPLNNTSAPIHPTGPRRVPQDPQKRR